MEDYSALFAIHLVWQTRPQTSSSSEWPIPVHGKIKAKRKTREHWAAQ